MTIISVKSITQANKRFTDKFEIVVSSKRRQRSLSSGNAGRPMSLEQWSDRNDISTLGQNEDWKVSRRTVQSSSSASTWSTIPWMLRGRPVCTGHEVLRTITLWRSRGYWTASHQTLLPGVGKISWSQLRLCEG